MTVTSEAAELDECVDTAALLVSVDSVDSVVGVDPSDISPDLVGEG